MLRKFRTGHHQDGDQATRNLRSLIWGFGNSCMTVHDITSQPAKPANVFSNVVYLQPHAWLQFERETFQPPFWGVRGDERVGDRQFDSLHMWQKLPQ